MARKRMVPFAKKLREDHGLRQRDIAELAGVTVGTVHTWEREMNTRYPDPRAAMRLSQHFNVPIESFFAPASVATRPVRPPHAGTKELQWILRAITGLHAKGGPQWAAFLQILRRIAEGESGTGKGPGT